MLRIVIAGAGPIGLFSAIRLKQLYADHVEVTVLDARLDSYDRPGVIAYAALTAVESGLGFSLADVKKCDCSPSAIYIRDLQKALYAVAVTSGVLFKAKDCVLDGTDVKCQSRGSSTAEAFGLCHLLIDCSGGRRSIIRDLSTDKIIAHNPMPYHFLAYVDMDKENADKMKMARSSAIDLPEMARFRQKTGWQEYIEPSAIDVRHWPRAQHPLTDSDKGYCLYFEVPKSIAEDSFATQVSYLKDLLRLQKGVDIDFRPSLDRGAFLPFEVQITELSQKHFVRDKMPVVALGDSLMSADYRMGLGVSNGVACASALVGALTLKATQIEVIEELWDVRMQQRVTWYHHQIKSDFSATERRLLSALAVAYQTHIDLPEDKWDASTISDRQQLASRLKAMGDMSFNSKRAIAKTYYQQAARLLAHPCFNKRSSIDLQCRIFSNLGRAEKLDKHYDRAIDYFQQSLELALEFGIKPLDSLAKSLLSFLSMRDLPMEQKQRICELLRRPLSADGSQAPLHENLPAIDLEQLITAEQELAAAEEMAVMRAKNQALRAEDGQSSEDDSKTKSSSV